MATFRIAVIPGDGIGPEVIDAAIFVLDALGLDMEFVMCEAGLRLWERTGKQLTDETIEKIRRCDSCLKGPTATPVGPRTFRSVAVMLREELDLHACVRPFQSYEGIPTLRPNVNFLLIRETTEDLYRGIEYRVADSAIGMRIITKPASERIARFAFEWTREEGRKKITIVHKATIFKETCGLFREACFEVAKEYPEIEVDELLADAAAYRMITEPETLDVILTTNVFGDILADVAAGVVGSLGLIPSATLGDRHSVFETAHGTAPDIAGKGIANPCAMILAASMMLKHLGLAEEAAGIKAAIQAVLMEGKHLTPDLGGSSKTSEVAKAIVDEIRKAYS